MPVNGQPTLIENVRNIITTYKGTVGDGMSLADISKIARVEPITLISSNLTGVKDLYTILHGVLNIYSAHYLQAVNILSTQMVDSRILRILDKTNPDRDLKTFLTAGQFGMESLNLDSVDGTALATRTLSLKGSKYRLPMLQSDNRRVATESLDHESFYGEGDQTGEDSGLNAAMLRVDSFDKLGITVGKVIEVSFFANAENDKDGQKVRVPVVVKLDTMIMPSEAVQRIVTANTDEISFGSRFQDAIDGRIGFVKDFILCQDLIKSQKKALIKDPTNYYSILLKRVNNSKMYSALSGNISMAGISSIYVISEEDEAEVQKKIGGKLNNQKTRDMVFDNTSAMMIVVIDKEWERVSIYVRDVKGFSQASFESFRNSTDKGSTVIADMLKGFTMNNPPSF
jgi:hypothetical protein